MWDSFVEYILIPFDKGVLTAVPEIGHLSPIILSIGTAFVALVTLNFPLMMLSGSTVEAYLIYNALSSVGAYTVTPLLGVIDAQLPEDQRKFCKSFFQTLTPSRFDYLMSKGLRANFPNSPLYFISFAAAYCIQSMYFFSEECSELGPQYSNRPYLAIIASGMFILLYSIYLLAFSCDSGFTLMFTIILGLLAGYLICYQNFLIFGKSAVDLLFIPSLARRTGMDYICVTTNPTTSQVTMGPFDNNDVSSKLSVSWQAIPLVSSYTVKFYTTNSASPSNGTLFQTISNISSSTLTASATYPLTNTYYYATVTGVSSDGSTSSPIPSTGAIQINPVPYVTMKPFTQTDQDVSVTWIGFQDIASYEVQFYSSSSTTPANGTPFGSSKSVNTPTLKVSSDLIRNMEAGKHTYYYATVTPVLDSGVKLPPITSSGSVET